ncbi:UDP-glucose dehydrogenase family protein [Bordetella bronchiseptica]|uniref:UDP-glucose 6-dehydrogenase n=1 Tax=Bordetella bronchiseptica (strain ATCC BAA-588 / NCTC 13252 / RB50) TaxID=257310 RepID=A0A0H3LY63_BORBR|nr:UDP-glucose/GDP-mannose dehydrogenase family protein [Bordetella bronchiseptica]KAK63647.1 nucleotide sugar dehydrogenase [Bordetella bronchiseptica 980-2]AMG86452.1 UDP-glucose/GDP-mannose dehydrogenase family protein [Bordetella bronchiseptica]KCV50550.1 nucleotide sugar dehydrogenase [Bordetella bronchiseptica 3E44]KCV55142.1 nucleotide sugar dehydrogenase [Bordetella bronchiseptica 980]KDB61900.1 nucleotide sugar dehydrogenase [Bordetella bronchiseptica B18-5 (C3)]
MKITVVGTGYVGLVSGACLADMGNEVLCLDTDAAKVAMLREGHIPIYEPGLEDLVKRNVAGGRLQFTDDIAASVAFGDVQFIAVGTPPGEDGSADLQYVLAAARSIARHMTTRKVVVDKSTVPVGTADKVRAAMQEVLAERGVEVPFSVASNPEFLKEGAAINDFMSPDRIIVGADDEHTIDTMRRIYAPFQRTHERVMVMDVRSAELTKYAANAMLATRISFMNEMANLAEALGADIEQVRRGIGADPRIGYHFLYPGIGYGGSCFPKDVQALMRSAGEHALPMRVIEAAETANQAQKLRLAHKVVARYGADLQGRTFALWGLAFKPNTDDMREAPSLSTIADLTRRGARIRAYDPVAMPQAAKVLDDNPAVELVDDMYQALDGADGLLIATEWKVFRAPDLTRVKQMLKAPLIIDGRNLYVPADMRAQGFDYQGIGRA